MPRMLSLTFAVFLLPMLASSAAAQEWRPSWRDMPTMPSLDDLSGDWLNSRTTWFDGTAELSGVRPSELSAVAQARSGKRAQVVHFNDGPLPVIIWQDRNGDSRADMIEIYHSGAIAAQVIDADYDGRANVVRTYDASGSLMGEERL